MNPKFFRKLFFYSVFSLTLLIIFNSCRKDNASDQHLNAQISDAKSWYETSFNTSSTKKNLDLSNLSGNLDLSQIIDPDWQKAALYERYGDDVYEMPIENPDKFGLSLKDNLGHVLTKKEYSRTSLLLLKNQGGYKAYIMVVLADSNYVKKDLNKLDNNHYRKHDADFSGVLLYYTPQGQLLRNWTYKEGKIINNYIIEQMNPDSASTNKQSQSIKRTNPYVDICTDFYTRAFVEDHWTDWIYSYTRCRTEYYPEGNVPGGGGGTSGGPGTSSGGSGGGTTSPNPYNPCNPTAGGSTTNAYKTLGNAPYEPGPSDGGFPPPTETAPCPTVQYIPKDTILTSSFYNNDKAMCVLQKLMAASFYKNTLNNFIGASKPVDLTFKIDPIAEQPGFIQYGKILPNTTNWSFSNIDLTINANRIDNMAGLQVAMTLLHEGIHAEIYRKLSSIGGPGNLTTENFPAMFKMYQQYSVQNGFSHEYMADHYISIMANALKKYDNDRFDLSYYEAYAWQGLEETDFYIAKSAQEKKNIQDATSALLSGRSTTGCTD